MGIEIHPLRCIITSHPCGTDTVASLCQCPPCRAHAEIASLRAELADVKSDRQHFVDALAAQVERTKAVEAAARQDAERVEAAFAERDSYMASNTKLVERIRQDAEDRAADIEAAEKRGYDCGVNDITRQDAEEIARLEAQLACRADTGNCVMDEGPEVPCNEINCRYVAMEAARRQDAEEKARLKEALKPFAQAADEVDRYVEDRRLASTFENNLTVSHLRDARAALACRPQGERSET